MSKFIYVITIGTLLAYGSSAFAGPHIGKKFKSKVYTKSVTQMTKGNHNKTDIALGSVVGDVHLGKKFKSKVYARDIVQSTEGNFNKSRLSMGSVIE